MMVAARSTREARALDSESFDDYHRVGKGSDARKRPDPIAFDNHYFEPVNEYKLFDVVTPHVYGGEVFGYSDNLFHDPDGSHPIHTPFSRTTLGTREDIQLQDHVFSAGYRAIESFYFRAPHKDDDIFEQGADARLELNWNDVAAHGDFSWTRSAFPTQIQIRGLAREDALTTDEWIEGGWNRLGGKLGVYFRRDDFLNHDPSFEPFDHKTAGASAQVNFRIYEKIHALLEYNFEAVRFDESINRDYDAHQLRAGVDGELTPKLTLSIKLGATYQVPYRNTGDFQDNSRFFGFSAACALAWQALPTLVFSTAYRRDLTYAVGANFETVDYLDLGTRWTFGPSEKMFLAGEFSWEHAQPDQGGHEDRIHAKATYGYKIQRWLEATTTYEYVQVLAGGRFKSATYDEHRWEVALGLGF